MYDLKGVETVELRRWRLLQDNLVLSTGLVLSNGPFYSLAYE